jgi:hypothetical protein
MVYHPGYYPQGQPFFFINLEIDPFSTIGWFIFLPIIIMFFKGQSMSILQSTFIHINQRVLHPKIDE